MIYSLSILPESRIKQQEYTKQFQTSHQHQKRKYPLCFLSGSDPDWVDGSFVFGSWLFRVRQYGYFEYRQCRSGIGNLRACIFVEFFTWSSKENQYGSYDRRRHRLLIDTYGKHGIRVEQMFELIPDGTRHNQQPHILDTSTGRTRTPSRKHRNEQQ